MQLVRANASLGGQQDGGRSVADLAAVAGRDDSIGLEGRRQLAHAGPVGGQTNPLVVLDVH